MIIEVEYRGASGMPFVVTFSEVGPGTAIGIVEDAIKGRLPGGKKKDIVSVTIKMKGDQ